MRAVNGTPLKADTVQAGLYNYVLLGVDAPADFMPCSRRYIQLIPETTKIQAVLGAGRGAIVARSQDVFVSDGYGTDMVPATG